MMRVSLARHSSLSLGIILWEMNRTLDSEWFRMLVSSVSELSGRMGTATRPKAVALKKATTQLGMFWEMMATRSPCLIPKRVMRRDSWFTLRRNSS